MIIMLEGPDGSGKTTLIENITDILDNIDSVTDYALNHGCETHPNLGKDRISEKNLYNYLNCWIKTDSVLLIDRGAISDIVYRVFDDYKPVTSLNKFIKFLKKNEKHILTIYCRTDKAEENMLKRGDDNPIALAKHKEITKVYDLVMDQIKDSLKYNYIKYDYSKKSSINEALGKVSYFCYMASK